MPDLYWSDKCALFYRARWGQVHKSQNRLLVHAEVVAPGGSPADEM